MLNRVPTEGTAYPTSKVVKVLCHDISICYLIHFSRISYISRSISHISHMFSVFQSELRTPQVPQHDVCPPLTGADCCVVGPASTRGASCHADGAPGRPSISIPELESKQHWPPPNRWINLIESIVWPSHKNEKAGTMIFYNVPGSNLDARSPAIVHYIGGFIGSTTPRLPC